MQYILILEMVYLHNFYQINFSHLVPVSDSNREMRHWQKLG